MKMGVFCVGKNMYRNFWLIARLSSPAPLSRWGFWKSLGQPLHPPAARRSGLCGIWAKIHSKKPELPTYFLAIYCNFQGIFERLSPNGIGYVYPPKSGASPGISEKSLALKNVWWWNSNLRPNNPNSLPHPLGLTIPGHSLLCDLDIVVKKYFQNSGFCSGIFARSSQPIGNFENPSGNQLGPRNFQNPLWASGDLGQIP